MTKSDLTLQIHETPNRRVLAAANKFHDAAALLYEVDALTVPTVVNAALALELYLKCLDANILFQDGRVINGGAITYDKVCVFANSNKEHVPHKLLKALPRDVRDFLDASFSKRYSEEHEKLESVLERYQSVFVDWRYLFEGKGKAINLSELFEILEFFKKSTAESASCA